MRVGTRVRVERDRASTGTWRTYAGRTGWVAGVNRQRLPTGRVHVEYGVSWTRPTVARNPSVDAWFVPDELVSDA